MEHLKKADKILILYEDIYFYGTFSELQKWNMILLTNLVQKEGIQS